MFLAPHHSTASFPQLPTETLREIASYLPNGDLTTLCRVSQICNAVAFEFLYRAIDVKQPSDIISCCKTLGSNSAAARVVKSFAVSCPESVYTIAFYRVLTSALFRISAITNLDLYISLNYPDSHLRALEHCSFPHLRVLKLDGLFTKSVALFVRNNGRSLEGLAVLMSDADDWLPLCSSGDFPKLISYHGDVHILPFVLSGSKLRVIYISVSADDDIEVVFETLHTVRESLRCFSMFMEFWDVQCIDIISKHIPDLQVLRLMCHLREDGADHSQALSDVASLLPKFTGLRELEIEFVFPFIYNESVDKALLAEDYERAQLWGQLCPSLCNVKSPITGVYWHRSVRNKWAPDWVDRNTCLRIFDMEVEPIAELSWLEEFVCGLCAEHGLLDPFRAPLGTKFASYKYIGSLAEAAYNGEDYPHVIVFVSKIADLRGFEVSFIYSTSKGDIQVSLNKVREFKVIMEAHL